MLRNGLTKLGIKVPYEAIDQLFNINKLNRNDINSGLEKLELITKDKKLDSETFSHYLTQHLLLMRLKYLTLYCQGTKKH